MHVVHLSLLYIRGRIPFQMTKSMSEVPKNIFTAWPLLVVVYEWLLRYWQYCQKTCLLAQVHVMYRIYPTIRRGFCPSKMTSNNYISPMKFWYNTTFTLLKQSQRSRSISRSIFQDGSRSLGLFWKENNPSYNRRNTVHTFESVKGVHYLSR